jgi:hypothetical protein
LKKINFRTLFHEICWSYELNHPPIVHADGTIQFNKLFITKTEANYKTNTWKLTKDCYQKAKLIYLLVNSK